MHTSLFNVIIKSIKEDPQDWLPCLRQGIAHKTKRIEISTDYSNDIARITLPNGIFLKKEKKTELFEAVYNYHKKVIGDSFANDLVSFNGDCLIKFCGNYLTVKGFNGDCLTDGISIFNHPGASEKKLTEFIKDNNLVSNKILNLIKLGDYSWYQSKIIEINGLRLSLNYLLKTITSHNSGWVRFDGEEAQTIFNAIEENYTEEIIDALDVFGTQAKTEKAKVCSIKQFADDNKITFVSAYERLEKEPDFSDNTPMPKNKTTSFFAHFFLIAILTGLYMFAANTVLTTEFVTKQEKKDLKRGIERVCKYLLANEE